MSETRILIAQIGAAQGIKGEVRVKPFGEPDMLDQYGKLETSDGRKFKITRMTARKNMLVVKFMGVNSRSEAEALNGTELFVERNKLPETDDEEFYVSDLIGMSIINMKGTRIGTLKDVPNFGAGDLLEIEPLDGSTSYYLSFTREIAPEIDFEAGTITVDPPTEVSERDEEV